MIICSCVLIELIFDGEGNSKLELRKKQLKTFKQLFSRYNQSLKGIMHPYILF